jgi:hypothetical protein
LKSLTSRWAFLCLHDYLQRARLAILHFSIRAYIEGMKDYPFERTQTVYPAGTLLRVRAYGVIRHYGIATGYGTVIHTSARFGRVEETDMAAFSNGNTVTAVNVRTGVSGSELVARARLRKGDRYNALFNNCQHFVTWVMEGRGRSEQLGPLDARRLSGK